MEEEEEEEWVWVWVWERMAEEDKREYKLGKWMEGEA